MAPHGTIQAHIGVAAGHTAASQQARKCAQALSVVFRQFKAREVLKNIKAVYSNQMHVLPYGLALQQYTVSVVSLTTLHGFTVYTTQPERVPGSSSRYPLAARPVPPPVEG